MKIILYFISLTLIVHLFLLFQLPCSDGKSIALELGSGSNSTSNGPKSNATDKAIAVRSPADALPAAATTIKRIKRARTDLPKVKLSFHDTHLPCDYDVSGSFKVMDDFPKYCRDSYQQRFMSEAEYRLYMLYQTEGFFFGQYHERMLRFEIDVHTFDYRDTGF